MPFGITVYAINLASGAKVLRLGAGGFAECGCKGIGYVGVVHNDIIRLIVAAQHCATSMILACLRRTYHHSCSRKSVGCRARYRARHFHGNLQE